MKTDDFGAYTARTFRPEDFAQQQSPSIQPDEQPQKIPTRNGTAVSAPAPSGTAEPMHWRDLCIMSEGKNPKPLAIVANALIALRRDPAVKDAFAFDQMQCMPMLIHDIGKPDNNSKPRPMTDEDVVNTQEWLQQNGLPGLSRETVRDAISVSAKEHSYHPVRDYFESLKWDGTPRTGTYMADCVSWSRGHAIL